MFGIGGGEFIFIILVVLMFFGSDKIPEMARNVAKGIAHLKNATNDIKSEIHKGVTEAGIDPNALTGGIKAEIAKAKEGFTKMVEESEKESGIKSELDNVRENFAKMNQETMPESAEIGAPETSEPIDGPVKRQS